MSKKIILFLLFYIISIGAKAQCGITGTTTVCVGTTETLTGATCTGGTYSWSSTNPTVATLDAGGVLTALSAGTSTISYSDGTPGGTSTTLVTVNSLPSVVASGRTSICNSTSTSISASGAVSYSWSPNDGLSSITSPNPTASPNTTTTYTVIGTDANGCTNIDTVTVNVDDTVVLNILLGNLLFPNPNVCVGSTLAPGTMHPPTGGIWSSSNTSVATVSSTGTVYGTTAGTTTISWTYTNACNTVGYGFLFTIGSPTVAAISGASSVCAGSDITLADATPGGTWSSSDNTLATVNSTGVVHGLAAGSPTISYAVTNSCGTTTVTYPITVNPLPNAGVIAIGPRILCRSTPTTFTSSGDAGGSWSISSGTWATINSSTGVVTGVTSSNTLPHTATITYTVTSPHGCGSAYNTLFIRIKGKPALTITPISSLNICTGDIRTLTSSTAGGTFEWSTSANTSIATVSTTVATVTGVSVGTGSTISYAMSDTNYCTSNSFTYNVVARPVLTIGGSTTISTSGGPGCAPNSVVWTVTGGSGGSTYSWTSSGTAVSTVACTTCVGSTSNTITAVGTSSPSETYTVAITAASYCSIPPVASKTIYVVACKSGITEPEIENVAPIDKIKVYPNPNNGLFTLELPTSFDATAISIADITGKIIYAKITQKDKLDFDLCGYPHGMYIISVTAGDKKYREKLLLE